MFIDVHDLIVITAESVGLKAQFCGGSANGAHVYANYLYHVTQYFPSEK